jgi:NIMA (never in mitosis gene a)-related kinase
MEKYIKKKLLGSGGFAKVYLAVDSNTGKEYAMKSMDISQMRPEDCKNEISLFQNISHLSHPNIVKYETSFMNTYKRKCVIIMEYCGGGDLSDIIQKNLRRHEKIAEDKIMELLIGMLLGIQYIHQNGIIHRDLKPKNILIDDMGNPKISDFGISKTLEACKKRTNTIVGSYTYMSPEALKGNECETNSDIWSLGCIIHELCCFVVVLE